ncbi:MAG: serine/threonine-protein kinase PknK, partial [Cyanobacteria bacterium J06632_3]
MISTPQLPGYQIGELIYSGTKSLVYRGVRINDNTVNKNDTDNSNKARPVLVKVLRDTFPSLSEQVQFGNQHTIACQLESAHVLKPLALERYDNGYALILPDQGTTVLSEYWPRGTQLVGNSSVQPPLTNSDTSLGNSAQAQFSLSAFLNIAIQLTEALHELGKKQVIHKDIKPSNIVIHPKTQHIQLIDFSLSSLLPKEQQRLANITALEGTLAYISPEQTGRMNRSLDYRTDFYSLGVTFFELLTGQLPFDEDEPLALLHCHLAKTPPSPHELNENIPNILSDIVLKLMAKNAENRYQSALGLKYDLEKCRESLSSEVGTGEVGTREISTQFELGTKDVSDRFLIPEKLYGRQKEVTTLLNAFERVSAGRAELVMVTGFSGIGKTAVVNEVHKPITRQQGYFIQGKFDQLNRNRPFSAFLQAFNELIEQLLSDSDAQLASWRSRILEAVGNNGQVLIDVMPALTRIIGPQPYVIKLSGSAAENRFNLLLSQFVRVFATADHPLVIFLDDLQWVDSASLRLLKLLVEDVQSKYLLLIGAYRNNEVSPAHPLTLTLADIPAETKALTTLTLTPLKERTITQLVADTLKCPEAIALPLAKQIYQKTSGNPFFTTQFLQGLHQDGWITFDADTGYWQCDLAEVQQLALTDDVVDFMLTRLRKLPAATRAALKLAACIGNQFDLATLAIASQQSQSQLASDLWQGLQEGFVIPNNTIYKFFQGESTQGKQLEAGTLGYRFLHDRVQQAAYALIPKEKKQALHWQIGQQLLQQYLNNSDTTLSQFLFQSLSQKEALLSQDSLSSQDLSSQDSSQELAVNSSSTLFEIVNQLNAGSSEATSERDRHQLIQLNELAGQKAKEATAYAAALSYFQESNQLLPTNRWEQNDGLINYEFVLRLKCETIEAAYLNLDLASVGPLIEEVLSRAHTLLDKIKVYEIQIQAAIGDNQLIKAVEQGFEVLEKLGVPLIDPETVTISLPVYEQLETVPEMSDPAKVAALRILVSMFSAIYNGKPDLLKPTIWTMVNLCTTAGHTAVSAMAYSVYGMSMCGSGHIEEGYQSGRIAQYLIEQPLGQAVKAKVLEQLGGFISHWKDPVKTSIEQFEQGLQSGLEMGDIEYACHAAKNACAHLVLLGTPLHQVQQKQLQYIELGQQLNQQHILIFAKIWRQLS